MNTFNRIGSFNLRLKTVLVNFQMRKLGNNCFMPESNKKPVTSITQANQLLTTNLIHTGNTLMIRLRASVLGMAVF